ncbi:MAG: efflux transporter outer membrane subunit [Gammaproteobacteria bacterium]|nr:MAG: efflux transporter outer membrane subunit [Gammaproteobacteria bacterium]
MDFYQRCVQLLAIALPICLSACMVGPNFHQPDAPNVSRYTETPLPMKTASTPSAGQVGKPQLYVYQQTIPAEWWYLFHSPEINHLVEKGLANSPNLASAMAALRQAQETLNAQIGNSLFPAFDALGSGERQRAAQTPGSSSSVFNTVNASVNVSYTLDVFGGARRQIEALQAQVDYQQFQLLAAYLTLTTNIVTTAVTIASLEEQIEATRALVKDEEQQLTIIQKQFHLGGIADTTVLTQQTLVEQTRATLPPLEKSLSQSRHALSVLVGDYPDEKISPIRLEALVLPTKLPVSLPSDLVRQRPDVRASEALWHAASAQVGVATANLFPQFTITGTYGWSGSAVSSLFQSNNKVWNYLGQITQPVFHGGALLASRRGAIDAYDQSAAQYRQTVLQAFQNVADTLRALETDARTFQAQKAAEKAAYKNLKITQEQYFLGAINYLNLLTAEQQYHQTLISRIQAQATRYTDTAALFQALGGGWWNRHKGDYS